MYTEPHLSDFIAFTSANDIALICNNFFKATGLNHFDYTRVYHDKKFVCLTSDASWETHFWKRKFKLSCTLQQTGIHLWETYHSEQVLNAAKNLDHEYGISIFKKNVNFVECFNFSAPTRMYKIKSFYFNNLDLLQNFCLFFKEQAQSLINKAVADKVRMPETMYGKLKNNIDINDKQKILKQIQPQRYFFQNGFSKISLTKTPIMGFSH